eukprot:m.40237 g.40237  ORF g.40237 m.40237 type:complete len:173 (+) comp5600_c0_seq1:39-557(+)
MSAPAAPSTAPSDHRVVVAVDPSPAASAAVSFALDVFCRTPGDVVHLVHAYPKVNRLDPLYFNGPGGSNSIALDKNTDTNMAIQANRERYVADYVSRVQAMVNGRCKCQGVSVAGDAREIVIAEADKLNATAVIVGSRGLGPVQRAVLGSVSTHLVMHCKQPVIVIKTPTQA